MDIMNYQKTREAIEALEAKVAEMNGKQLNSVQQDVYNEMKAEIHRLKELPEPALTVSGMGDRYAITTDGQTLRMFAKGEKVADAHRASAKSGWRISDFIKGSMGFPISNTAVAVERGVATTPDFVSAEIIDAVRAKCRVIQAGALTIPIIGKTTIARIATDPTVYEHVEAVADISESIPVFQPVTLDPGSLAALIPLSQEIVQDSPNLDAALQTAIAGAFALKLDQLSIAKILADTAIPDSSAGEDTETCEGTLAAVGTMLAANQEIPKALIAGPGDFIKRAGELSSDAGVWLGPPPVLKSMLDLPTSTVTDGTAILGDFALGFAIAVRMDLRLEVVRWGKPTAGSHLLVAYARMSGYVLQPGNLYKQKKTVT